MLVVQIPLEYDDDVSSMPSRCQIPSVGISTSSILDLNVKFGFKGCSLHLINTMD